MLTSVGRAAARRVQTATTSSTTQLVSRQISPSSTIAIRSLSISSLLRQPTSAEEKPARKPRAKKAATTVESDKKEKTTKKAAPKVEKAKKEVTAEMLEKIQIRQQKKEITQLRKWALLEKVPRLPSTTWTLYTSDNITGSTDGSPMGKTKELAQQFKQLSASELKDLETRSHANRETNIETLKRWVESHEPAQILLANQSRARLSELQPKNYKPIKDERLPVAPTNSYGLYVKANYDRTFSEHGGDFGKAATVLSQHFKDLSASEKRQYEEKREDLRAAYKGRMDVLLEQVEKIRNAPVEK